jgi:peptidoglycan/xylan/chitin deacetylase (PgdA/CDA1 family)
MGAPWLPVLTYHRVFEANDDFPFDRDVIEATPAEFELQMATLKKYFHVIGTEELRAHIKDHVPLPLNPVIVSFDDGYLDNHRNALPVLKKHGLKAVFFMATRFINERRLFWWDKISFLLRRANTDRLKIAYPLALQFDLKTQRASATAAIFALIKEQYALDLDRFIDELAEALHVQMSADDERQICAQMMMTWNEIRELRREGMEVQSHTRTHRILHTLTAADLRDELHGSASDLAQQLGERPYAISYPIGRSIDHLVLVCDMLRDAGYELGFTNGTGVNMKWMLGRGPLNLRREALQPGLPLYLFRGVMAVPQLAYS